MNKQSILNAKTPKTAAKRFYAWVLLKAAALGKDSDYIFLWSPEESKQRGYGNCWTVCWEEGPFEWAPAISGGSDLYAGEAENFSKPGPFPNGLRGFGWLAEPWNSFILGFYIYKRQFRKDGNMNIINDHKMTMTLELVDDEGFEYDAELPINFVVCNQCQGHGQHVNSNIDGHGIE